ncbi:hypothetical protein Tco_1080620 [Tanacetum coccineum]|uniref:Reverse transcriptase domain-containing protein n=1 Tax=Tanacetum coccineum TaxID=301880 RepID=A0ABQ5HVP9_9ASTR
MSRSTSTRTIYIVTKYDRSNSPFRQPAHDSEEDPNKHWDSDLQRDVDDTATTPASVEAELAIPEESEPFEQEEYHPLILLSRPWLPTTLGDRNLRTLMSLPHGQVIVGFASGLNQLEQNRIQDLTKATNTARHRLDLQADTMNGMMGTIHRMDTQMTWMQRDYRASRAESQNAIMAGRSTRSNTANNTNPPNETTSEVARQLNTALPNLLTQLVEALRGNRANQRDVTQSCNFNTFKSCGAKEFFGTKGAVSLLTWFEGMKFVLHINFKKLLMEEYYPGDEIQKLEYKFWNYKMVGSDIDGYTARFYELARFM